MDCEALSPKQDAPSRLLLPFKALDRLKSLRILKPPAGGTGGTSGSLAWAPILATMTRLEVLSLQDLDGFCDHGLTLTVWICTRASLFIPHFFSCGIDWSWHPATVVQ
jgi:hypothetical protein